MNASRRFLPDRPRQERGAILVWAVVLLSTLLMFTAFSVDVGSWYARGSKVQRAADAAALAAVVHLPADPTTAKSVAAATLQKNGIDPLDPDIDVVIETQIDNPSLSSRQIRVEVRDTELESFFAGSISDGVTITRSARAEFSEALALGSPLNMIGTGVLRSWELGGNATTIYGQDRQNFWLAVNGQCTAKEDGDQILSPFDGSGVSCGPSANPSLDDNLEYDPEGYTYQVEVPDTSVGVDIKIYDPSFWPDSGICQGSANYGLMPRVLPTIVNWYLRHCNVSAFNSSLNGSRWTYWGRWVDATRLGSSRYTSSIDQRYLAKTGKVTTVYTLLGPDNTPDNLDDNPVLTTASFTGGVTQGNEICGSPYYYDLGSDCATNIGSAYVDDFIESTVKMPDGSSCNPAAIHPSCRYVFRNWFELHEINPGAATGTYYVRVKTSTNEPTSFGTNAFSLAAVMDSGAYRNKRCDTRSGATWCPQVSGTETMSILAASSGSVAELYLAQIPETEAGKTMQVTIWDPGEEGDRIWYVNGDLRYGAQQWPFVWRESTGPYQLYGSYTAEYELDVSGCGSATQPGTGRVGDCKFNDRSIEFLLDVPTDYQTSDYNAGWWRINYEFSGAVSDRTTWRVEILGDPVHLIPDV